MCIFTGRVAPKILAMAAAAAASIGLNVSELHDDGVSRIPVLSSYFDVYLPGEWFMMMWQAVQMKVRGGPCLVARRGRWKAYQ